MLLIFRLGRPDVLPVSDYGVRKGFALTFGKLQANGQSNASRPAQARGDGEARKEMASLALGGKLVPMARLRFGQNKLKPSLESSRSRLWADHRPARMRPAWEPPIIP